jgi:molybdate/tungstate transport system substrate-binding protein
MSVDASAQTSRAPFARSDSLGGPLIITTASSFASTVRKLAYAFSARHPGVAPDILVGGSVAVARAVADSVQVPDVFVSSDDTLIDAMLMPRSAAWSAGFARSVLVLAYTSKSKYADEITTRNWADVLSKPDVRGARGNPSEDPSAYRVLMFFELAARFYLRPRLSATLEHAMPIKDFGQGDRELEAQFNNGLIDYMPTYRTLAAEHELEWLELPAPINFGDTAFASSYAAARVRLHGGRTTGDTATIFGAPILYGLTVPRAAPHPALALAFAQYVLSVTGLDLIRNSGFDVPDRPILRGEPPVELRALSAR